MRSLDPGVSWAVVFSCNGCATSRIASGRVRVLGARATWSAIGPGTVVATVLEMTVRCLALAGMALAGCAPSTAVLTPPAEQLPASVSPSSSASAAGPATTQLIARAEDKGISIRIAGAEPASEPCRLTVRARTPVPTLPPLGIALGSFLHSYEKGEDCDRSDEAVACRSWRLAQLQRREAIAAEFVREVALDCRSVEGVIEALLPYRDLPLVATKTLERVDIDVPRLRIGASVDLGAAPSLVREGSLLAWCLDHPPELPADAVLAWRPGFTDQLSYYFNGEETGFGIARSPETMVSDLSSRKLLARFGDVKIERVERAQPRFFWADRALIVVSRADQVTAVLRHGREQFALLPRGDRFDLVFAFAGNATPAALRDYSVGSAWAQHVAADGSVGEPYWKANEEAPNFSALPSDTPQSSFDTASISKDGRTIVLSGATLADQVETGRFELRYLLDARSEGFVAKPIRRFPGRRARTSP
jgi:hypothetical protein